MIIIAWLLITMYPDGSGTNCHVWIALPSHAARTMGASELVDPPAGMRHCPDWTPTMAVASKATICCRLPAVPRPPARPLASAWMPSRCQTEADNLGGTARCNKGHRRALPWRAVPAVAKGERSLVSKRSAAKKGCGGEIEGLDAP